MQAEPVPDPVAREVRRRILDTLGIALGGQDEAPTRITRAYASGQELAEAQHATVWCAGATTSPESAAFANGTAMHSQDYMDTYLSPSGEACHPADTIPGVLALAEYLGSSADDVIRAVPIGYEVACRLCDAAEIRSRGWDHVTYIGMATACACAPLLELDDDALRMAISLAVIPNVALRQTRNGEISMWKACAPANAGQNGVRAARLAALGLEGPSEPFTGVNGVERRVSGEMARQALERRPGEPHAILRTHIKCHPTQYNAQAGVDAALAIRDRLAAPLSDDPLASVRVTMSDVCRQFTADSPNKWRPQTRETADHSMPYLVVVALREGRLLPSDFEAASFRDPERLADVAKVSVAVDTGMTADYPEKLSVRVEVEQQSGATSTEQVDHPLGRCSRPLSDDQVEEKFRRLATGRLEPRAIDELAASAWRLEGAAGVRPLMSLMGGKPGPEPSPER